MKVVHILCYEMKVVHLCWDCSLLQGSEKVLSYANIKESRYSEHSFCIGAATTAAVAGVPDMIKMMGRWESSAYLLYGQIPQTLCSSLPTVNFSRQSVIFWVLPPPVIHNHIKLALTLSVYLSTNNLLHCVLSLTSLTMYVNWHHVVWQRMLQLRVVIYMYTVALEVTCHSSSSHISLQ